MSTAAATVRVGDESYGTVLDEEPLVLLDFWAAWCGPRTALEPVVEEHP